MFSVLQRDPRLIARKCRGKIQFVLPREKVLPVEKREALDAVQRQIARVYSNGHKISRITVTPEGHVVYVFNNNAYFLGMAPEGPCGFQFEDI